MSLSCKVWGLVVAWPPHCACYAGVFMIDLKLVQKQPEVLAKALADRQSPLKAD